MTVRTQIALDGDVHRDARRKSTDLGISLAEYIRRLVAADLAPAATATAEVADVVDLGDGGPTDIVEDKDRLLGEAVGAAVDPLSA